MALLCSPVLPAAEALEEKNLRIGSAPSFPLLFAKRVSSSVTQDRAVIQPGEPSLGEEEMGRKQLFHILAFEVPFFTRTDSVAG